MSRDYLDGGQGVHHAGCLTVGVLRPSRFRLLSGGGNDSSGVSCTPRRPSKSGTESPSIPLCPDITPGHEWVTRSETRKVDPSGTQGDSSGTGVWTGCLSSSEGLVGPGPSAGSGVGSESEPSRIPGDSGTWE